jgi:hypothetical protein
MDHLPATPYLKLPHHGESGAAGVTAYSPRTGYSKLSWFRQLPSRPIACIACLASKKASREFRDPRLPRLSRLLAQIPGNFLQHSDRWISFPRSKSSYSGCIDQYGTPDGTPETFLVAVWRLFGVLHRKARGSEGRAQPSYK